MEIVAKDKYGNNADVSMRVSVEIVSSGTPPEGTVLPLLENSPIQLTLNHGIARLPRLTLCSRVGNYIGDYLLVFSAPGVESHSVKFAFSTGKSFDFEIGYLAKLRQLLEASDNSKRIPLVLSMTTPTNSIDYYFIVLHYFFPSTVTKCFHYVIFPVLDYE